MDLNKKNDISLQIETFFKKVLDKSVKTVYTVYITYKQQQKQRIEVIR